MRRLFSVGLAVLAVMVALVAAAVGAGAQDTATVTGPQLTPSVRTVVPGQRVDVVFTGWTARYATLSVCGNLARRGSADCNMVQSTGVRLTTSSGEESPVHDMVVTTPPTDCPCVLRAVGGDNGEVAVAPIDLVGHPRSPVADPDLGQPLIDVGLATATTQGGLGASLRRSLGGPAAYEATITVRNLTTEVVSGVAVHGRVSRNGDTVAEFDLEPGEIGPGLTWTDAVEVTLPAPVIGTYDWTAVASGAGPVAESSASTTAVPWTLLLLGLLLVGDLVAVIVRSVQRRRNHPTDHGPTPESTLADSRAGLVLPVIVARGRTPRPILVAGILALVAALLVPALGSAMPASAAPSDAVSSATNAYEIARSRLATSESAIADGRRREAAQVVWAAAAAELDRAHADEAEQRDRYGALSAEYFVHQGAGDSDVDDSMRLALAGGRQSLDRAKEVVLGAIGRVAVEEKVLRSREKDLERSREALDGALIAASEAGDRADQAIADAGATDLPAVAFIAYRRAVTAVNAEQPGCNLSVAVLAGLGRIASSHGRNLGSDVDDLGRVSPALRGLQGGTTTDTDQGAVDGDAGVDRAVGPLQLAPAVWVGFVADGDGDGRTDPDDLFDAARTTAAALCSWGTTLDRFDTLDAAVGALLGEGQQSTVVLGAARRYARTEGLDMGSVPTDPRVVLGDGSPQFDVDGVLLAPGDVPGMLAWAMTRLGTPYSQCLGPDYRPQDPICPPGTNRYGSGFFDCSGFVSHAYRGIGIVVPATTYAMEADPTFMATKVSDRIDLKVMQPGDVFLMDGHTGMYVGGGMIVHAIGRGLTFEPVPSWVANGTIAVLRPIDLLSR